MRDKGSRYPHALLNFPPTDLEEDACSIPQLQIAMIALSLSAVMHCTICFGEVESIAM